MGHESTIYGNITAIVSQPPKGEELYRLNQETLKNLPEEDSYPWITKWMFSTVPIGTQNIYRNQIIHFGASYKQLESDWHEWLDKFELILEKLHWFSATLHLETELVGNHQYDWIANIDQWKEGLVKPTTDWSFEGGPRDFREELNKKFGV